MVYNPWYKSGSVFNARFVCGPYNCLKNLSAAVNATRSATRILQKGSGLEPKVISFAQKLSNLGPLLNRPMQLKRITERAWEKSPKPMSDFSDFAAKIAILTLFQLHFAHF